LKIARLATPAPDGADERVHERRRGEHRQHGTEDVEGLADLVDDAVGMGASYDAEEHGTPLPGRWVCPTGAWRSVFRALNCLPASRRR
jgi:hypothetical protein